ncbi:Hsp20/alpha crystallin family protein [Halobacteria archaeon AArc-dxtr1]|nr:Hsp20/alpha crystallin family protein [Halobacteria archaeon AArc-dxtr1]
MRRNPFDELEEMLNRVSRQVEEGVTAGGLQTPGSVAVDVVDAGEAYTVTADLPGYETEDLELTLTEGTLQLEAARERSREHQEGEYVRRERTGQTVSRRIRLPEPVDEEGVSATYNNGVLTVRLPKETPGGDSKQIDIE